jgi:hypothetical protein
MSELPLVEWSDLMVGVLLSFVTVPLSLWVERDSSASGPILKIYRSVAVGLVTVCMTYWVSSVGRISGRFKEIDGRLSNLQEYIAGVGERELEKDLRRIAEIYGKRFEGSEGETRMRIKQAVREIADDMASGWAPIPVKGARKAVGDLLGAAEQSVMLSTKGVGAFWVEDKYYRKGRETAAGNCPVVEYHLFLQGMRERPPGSVQMRGYESIQDLSEALSRYDGDAGALCRAVIDMGGIEGFRHRELVLIDGAKVVEAELDEGGDPMKVRVTEAKQLVDAAVAYFRSLYDHEDRKCSTPMNDDRVRQTYAYLLGEAGQGVGAATAVLQTVFERQLGAR